MAMKIAELQIENVKRVKAVKLEPSENGLTIIGGDNAQGKTSVLDAIVWALGGNKYKPSEAQNRDSILPPKLHLVMNNGLVVERVGKSSALKVIDPSGKKGGQQLLNSFTEELALNLPKFMEASENSKADTLLRIIGVGDQLAKLDQAENKLYNERHTIGQIADQKEKYAKEMVYYPDTPNEPVSVYELVQEQQAILLKNAKNREKREQKEELKKKLDEVENAIIDTEEELEMLHEQRNKLAEDLKTAEKTVANLHDEETAEIVQTCRCRGSRSRTASLRITAPSGTACQAPNSSKWPRQLSGSSSRNAGLFSWTNSSRWTSKRSRNSGRGLKKKVCSALRPVYRRATSVRSSLKTAELKEGMPV